MQSNIISQEAGLPAAVRRLMQQTSSPSERFVVAGRTTFRVNSDMPFAWLVVTSSRLILCSTHKTRGLHRMHPYSEINEVRFHLDSRRIVVLPNNPAHGDFDVQLPGLTEAEFSRFQEDIGKVVAQCRPL